MSGFCVSMLAHLSDRHFARLILGQTVDHAFRYIEVGALPEIPFNQNKLAKLYTSQKADCICVV